MASNITKSDSIVFNNERMRILKQNGLVLWFTGLSASGKSTISSRLEKQLLQKGIISCRLDGDNLRFGLNKDLGFSETDRKENIRRTAEVANIIKNINIFVIVSFITPTEELRELARSIIKNNFYEVYVKCTLETCIKRDPKGLYEKALKNEISDFTGISAVYEEPKSPDLILDTEKLNMDECMVSLLDLLKIE